jgi:hypothetical protein
MRNEKNNITETYLESVKRLEKKSGTPKRYITETYAESAKRLEKTSKRN